MEIGIRALRDSLSRQLELVKAGYTVVVTEHGKPIAKIVPIEQQSNYDRLVTEGRITPAELTDRWLPDPIDLGASILDLVDDQRR